MSGHLPAIARPPADRPPAGGLRPAYLTGPDGLHPPPGGGLLGLIRHGPGSLPQGMDGIPLASPPMDVIGEAPGLEAWIIDRPVIHGESGRIRHARGGDWLFGVGHWPAEDMAGATRRAYRDILRLTRECEAGRLLRLWHYFPDINREQNGLERYRSFCLGRHEALAESGFDLTGDLPAASAVGTRGGEFWILFLAGRGTLQPLENPRQVSAFQYPPDYGPRSPSFSRAVRFSSGAAACLFVSGTASILGHRTVCPDDPLGQCRVTVDNLRVLLARAGAGDPAELGPRAAWKVYLRHASDHEAIRRHLGRVLDPASPIRYVRGDICRADLRVEIEGLVDLSQPDPA